MVEIQRYFPVVVFLPMSASKDPGFLNSQIQSKTWDELQRTLSRCLAPGLDGRISGGGFNITSNGIFPRGCCDCPYPLSRNSVRYCEKHLAACRDRARARAKAAQQAASWPSAGKSRRPCCLAKVKNRNRISESATRGRPSGRPFGQLSFLCSRQILYKVRAHSWNYPNG
jgi:hypothetical protein